MDDIKTRKARSVYRKVAEALDKKGWKYSEREEKLTIGYSVSSEETKDNYEFLMFVDGERQIVSLFTMPLMKFCKDKLPDGALAVCAANYILADGTLRFDLTEGSVIFSHTLSFAETSNLSVDAILYMVSYSLFVAATFAPLFKQVDEGKVKGEDFASLCGEIA